MFITVELPVFLLIWTQILCENITEVTYSLEDFTPKNKKIGNLIYSATTKETIFDNAFVMNHNNLFDLKVNGDIFTKIDIDRDEVCVKLLCCQDYICYLTIKAYLFKGSPIIFNIRIAIHDINDNKPMFYNPQTVLIIPESPDFHSTYKLPIATDADSAKYGVDFYTLSDSTNTFTSTMENNEPCIKLMKSLDREKISSYKLRLVAFDKGSPPLSTSLDITIKVSDINDNAPYFVKSSTDYTPLSNYSGSHEIKIKENVSGDIIYHFHAYDVDEGENAKIFYSISSIQSQPSDVVKQKFSLESPYETAKIQLRQVLDYEIEKERLILLVIVATDMGKSPKSSSVSLTVRVLDENDNTPSIIETMSKDIKENDGKRQQLKIFSVTDKDGVSEKMVNCTLSEDIKDRFELNRYDWNLYDLYNQVAFDFEFSKIEAVRVVCIDRGDPEITHNAQFYVKIIDENDNSPVFDKKVYETNLRENDSSQRKLTMIVATDADSGGFGTIYYTISAESNQNLSNFVRIDSETGAIYSNFPVDRETYKELNYYITATDNSGSTALNANETTHYNKTKLVIKILDENDNSPKFVGTIRYYKILENSKINTVVGELHFVDADEPPNNFMTLTLMEYNIHTHLYQRSKWFGIKHNNTIVVKTNLNREELKNVSLTVNVEDHGSPSKTSTEDIFIEILDENDNAPILTYPKNSSFISASGIIVTTPPDTKLIQLEANDPDYGVNATIKYEIIKSNFTIPNPLKINDKTGELSTNWHSFEQPEIGVYFLQISIVDFGSPSLSTHAIFYINITNSNMAISAEAYMSNIVILILIIVCSLALIVSLIAAIFWVRFRVTGDAAVEYQDENLEREHLNKDLNSNHYSLIALENNFRQSSFENGNMNAYDAYSTSTKQNNHGFYEKSNTLYKEPLNMLDSSRLTPCEDCFNSFGTMPSQINRYESPNIARFRSPIINDNNFPFCANSTNASAKTLILQTYPVSEYNAISNSHPPNFMGEPNFSDSGKGGSVEDLNFRFPSILSTFSTSSYNNTASSVGKPSFQQKKFVQDKNSETIF